MNILTAVNDQYTEPLRIMLASLFQNETEPLDIYLFYSDVSEENLSILDTDVQKRGGHFFPIPVENAVFQNAPSSPYYPEEVYYRILCSELLPETLERILYLDSDILIRGPVSSFYNMEFQGKTLIGVMDICRLRHLSRLGLSKEDVYVNSGVLLIHLAKMRRSFVLKDLLRLIEQNRDVLDSPDQDIINLYFKGEIGLADEIYNYPPDTMNASDFLRWTAGGWRKENPRIVHYMGYRKPWQPGYTGKYYFEYRRYHKQLQSGGTRICFAWKHCLYWFLEMIKGSCRVTCRFVTGITGGRL